MTDTTRKRGAVAGRNPQTTKGSASMARYTFVEYHNVTGGRRIPSAICTVESRVKTPEGFRRLFFKLKPDAPGYGFYKVHLTDEGAQIFCMGILAMAFIRDTSGSTDV